MEPKASPWRWFMIALVFLATLINYLDRQALSVAAPVLREEFSMSNVAYSRVVGWLVDNYSYRPVFFMFGVMPLVCASILWFWLGPIERGAVTFINHKSEEEKLYVTSK